jgi:hypothetical protein
MNGTLFRTLEPSSSTISTLLQRPLPALFPSPHTHTHTHTHTLTHANAMVRMEDDTYGAPFSVEMEAVDMYTNPKAI